MKHLKALFADPEARYVFLALCWFFGMFGIIAGLGFSAFIPLVWLKCLALVLLCVVLFAWMFAGCLAAIRMMHVS